MQKSEKKCTMKCISCTSRIDWCNLIGWIVDKRSVGIEDAATAADRHQKYLCMQPLSNFQHCCPAILNPRKLPGEFFSGDHNVCQFSQFPIPAHIRIGGRAVERYKNVMFFCDPGSRQGIVISCIVKMQNFRVANIITLRIAKVDGRKFSMIGEEGTGITLCIDDHICKMCNNSRVDPTQGHIQAFLDAALVKAAAYLVISEWT